MKLVPLMTYHANLAAALPVGPGMYGNRLIVEVDGGEFEGPRLKGVIRKAALAGNGTTEFGESYFVTAPRMQTGDPRYRWVNNMICVAQGKIGAGRVDYRVFEVVND